MSKKQSAKPMDVSLKKKLDFSVKVLFLIVAVAFFMMTTALSYEKFNVSLDVLWVVAAFVIVCIISDYIRNLIKMLLCFLASAALFIFLPLYFGGAYRIQAMLVSFATIVVGFLVTYKRWDNDYAVRKFESQSYLFIVPAAMYLVALFSKRDILFYEATVVAALIFAMNVWCGYLQNSYFYMWSNRHTYNFPGEAIYKNNTGKIISVLIFTVVIIACSVIYRMDGALKLVARVFVQCLVWIVNGIGAVLNYLLGSTEFEAQTGKEMVEYAEQEATSNPFWEIFYFFAALAFVLAILFILYNIVKGMFYRDGYNGSVDDGRLTEQITAVETVEEIQKEKKKHHPSNREKIRIKFKKTVEKELKGRAVAPFTSHELSEKIKEKKSSGFDAEGLARAYDKARYSTEEITEQDMRF